ncbi:FAD synthase [archaeon]|nr:FAD synthase [archaeon]
MVKVLAFGTFDILHPGHLSYLKQAKELGEKLVVIVATDNNVEKIKGKKPVNDEEHRKELVEALKIVDEAFVGFEDDMIKSVEKVKPDIVALGYDQYGSEESLKKTFDERNIKAKIVRLDSYKPELYKSSRIKDKVKES